MPGTLLLALALAASAADVAVRSSAAGEASRLEAEFTAPVPAPVAWEVLTDYGELPRFVSSLRESRVLRRWGGGCLIRQALRLEWWMLRRTFSVTLRVRENGRDEVSFEDEAKGDVKRYAGSWKVAAEKGGVRVRYRLEAEPKERLPRILVRRALADQARLSLEEIRREMLRRMAAKREIAERFRRRR
ncbi:MAG: SRPBCC family protein [Elusimicrobia bacterium]|nr:SRPBCC family protein [Elusimicrobiota bacterium]